MAAQIVNLRKVRRPNLGPMDFQFVDVRGCSWIFVSFREFSLVFVGVNTPQKKTT
jgi:hypothetical protein